MAFHPSQPARMYVYAAQAPTLNAELVDEQLFRASVYRNNLVALERDRRAANATARSERFPALAALEARRSAIDEEIEALRTQMKAASARARSKVRDPQRTEQIASLRSERRTVAAALKMARELANTDEGLRLAWAANDASAAVEKRRLRGTCGLAWGTYLCVESSVPVTGDLPRFRRHDRTGRLAVQLQATAPLSTDDLLAQTDTRIQLLPALVSAGESVRSDTHQKRVLLRFRIGSDSRKRPIFTEVPVILDRHLPAGKHIKWVYLIARPPGSHLPDRRWQVCFVLAAAEWADKNTAVANCACALDVNWRRVEDGLRVAVWHGEDGRQGEILLPNEMLEQTLHLEDVQSQRDDGFNAVKALLAGYLGAHPYLPDWLRMQTETLRQWRSQRRLAGLLNRWRGERHQGDDEIFALLDAWRKEDKHAYQHQERLRGRLIRRREWLYRNELLKLGRDYRTAFVEKLRVAAMRRTPGPEKDNAVVVRWRNLASIGRLLQLVQQHFVTCQVPAFGTTTLHLACGYDNIDIDKAPRVLTCAGCGADFDQDENAAEVILQRGLAALLAE